MKETRLRPSPKALFGWPDALYYYIPFPRHRVLHIRVIILVLHNRNIDVNVQEKCALSGTNASSRIRIVKVHVLK
jgi:hypothetical protein